MSLVATQNALAAVTAAAKAAKDAAVAAEGAAQAAAAASKAAQTAAQQAAAAEAALAAVLAIAKDNSISDITAKLAAASLAADEARDTKAAGVDVDHTKQFVSALADPNSSASSESKKSKADAESDHKLQAEHVKNHIWEPCIGAYHGTHIRHYEKKFDTILRGMNPKKALWEDKYDRALYYQAAPNAVFTSVSLFKQSWPNETQYPLEEKDGKDCAVIRLKMQDIPINTKTQLLYFVSGEHKKRVLLVVVPVEDKDATAYCEACFVRLAWDSNPYFRFAANKWQVLKSLNSVWVNVAFMYDLPIPAVGNWAVVPKKTRIK